MSKQLKDRIAILYTPLNRCPHGKRINACSECYKKSLEDEQAIRDTENEGGKTS